MANRVNLGKVAFRYMGAYSSSETYERLDFVTDGGSTFFSKKDGNTGNALPSTAAAGLSDEWWGVLAAGSGGSGAVRYVGTLDVTASTALDTVEAECADDGDVAMWTCADAEGETAGGYAVCASGLATALHSGDSRGVAVNLGDLLIARNDGGTVTVKCIPLNDAKKPADAGGVGTYGLMVPNDKEKLDQCVTDIDQTCFRSYSGEYNMNYCGWYGYWMYGTLGRPGGSSDGEHYVLRVANGGTETDDDGDTWIVLEQTAYSCMDAGRVFRRIVKTKDRNAMDTDGNTTWGDWTQIGGADIVVDEALDGESENPVQNKAIATVLEKLTAKVFPLTLTVTGGGVYKTGTTQAVTVKWTVKEGDDASTPDTVAVNGEEVVNTDTSKTYSGVTATTTYTVAITKDGTSKSGSVKAQFVNPSYFGVVDSGFTADADGITELTETVKAVKAFTTPSFTQSAEKNCYAYPKSFGALTSITDGKNEFLSSYTRSEVTVNGETYYAYVLTDASTVTDYTLQFK